MATALERTARFADFNKDSVCVATCCCSVAANAWFTRVGMSDWVDRMGEYRDSDLSLGL